jgi:hypothetical protein
MFGSAAMQIPVVLGWSGKAATNVWMITREAALPFHKKERPTGFPRAQWRFNSNCQ